jgi:hypothetical protein
LMAASSSPCTLISERLVGTRTRQSKRAWIVATLIIGCLSGTPRSLVARESQGAVETALIRDGGTGYLFGILAICRDLG